jgi:predicted RecB family nuclease
MLSKSKIIAFRQCPKRLWLSVNRPELAADAAGAQTAFATGHSVGAVAQKLYGPGELMFDGDKPDFSGAIARSCEASKRSAGTLFEAAYRADDTLVLADVVRLTPAGAEVIEVKSSSSLKDYHVEDAATQAHVMRRSGVAIRSVRIAHINTGFVYPGEERYDGLLTEVDITSAVDELAGEVPQWIGAAKMVLSGAEPDVQPGRQCTKPFECPFYDHCNKADATEYPIEKVPGLGARKVRALREAGIREARDIPAEMRDTLNVERAYQAVVTGAAQINHAAAQILRDLPYPRFFLDFETIAFAVPIWAGTCPHQALPFQWSIHVEAAPGKLEHYGFLDLSGDCPARASMVALIDRLSTPGPVLVYTGYEKGVLTQMGALFPDLAGALTAIVDRLVDLHPIARAAYYHRDMQGSWSIKTVLPTIEGAPSYDALNEVHNGLQAQAAYLEAIHPQTSVERRGEIHQHLTEYCRLDTLAMVALADRLRGSSESEV